MAPELPQQGASDDSFRLTLHTFVAAALVRRPRQENAPPPESVYREVSAFAQARRAADVSIERMLVELKRIISETTTRLDTEDARRLMDELVARAINAYYLPPSTER